MLGAVRKGRSSAPSLERELRYIGALIRGGDLLVRCLYVPSEDNPADAPSRGVVWKNLFNKHQRPKGQPKRKTDYERRVRLNKALMARLSAFPCDHPDVTALRRHGFQP